MQRVLPILGAVFAVAMFCATTSGAQPPLGPTKIGAEPWAPTEQAPKVIYGQDDRIDVYEETNPLRTQLAGSVCGLFPASNVTDNGDGTSTLRLFSYTALGLPPCDGEPFAGQPTSPFCTGFIVGDDIIATAGHCFSSTDLGGTKFVFGFQMVDASTPVSVVSND